VSLPLTDVLAAYHQFSGQASDNVRKLSFAAIGVIWVLKPAAGAQAIALPRLLLLAGILSVCALGFDFLQYVYGTIAWGAVHRYRDTHRILDRPAPRQINWPTNIFFAMKVLCVAVAYALLLDHMIGTLVAQ
jgi:hypothetical protein